MLQLALTFGLATFSLLLTILLSRNGQTSSKQKEKKSIKPLFQRGDALFFWNVAIPFAVGVALFNTLSTYIPQILLGINTETEASIIGAILIICGILCLLISGFVLDKIKQHVLWMKIAFPLAVLFVLIFACTYKQGNFGLQCFIAFGLGSTALSLLPVFIELAVFVAEEAGQGLVASVMWSLGMGLSVVLSIIFDLTRVGQSDYAAGVWLTFALPTACLGLVFAFPARLGLHNRLEREVSVDL